MEERKLLNIEEASKYVNRTKDTLRKAIKHKEIPYRLFRGGYLFSRLALELWAGGIEIEEIKQILIEDISKKIMI